MGSPDVIRVRVVYALPERQATVELVLEQGANVAEAVAKSGLAAEFPAISTGPLQCAIFGRVVSPTEALREGDRVEILRPLIADPKQSRRQAAARNPIGRARK
ncbi:RnfH family protein [Povalibacter sp.]|uniref:RnfH family protein n=1 Tax=Povalibacter sp. TaxID=1962978 RepID=UPI002F42A925